MAVNTVRRSPIYPCAIRASMVNALGFVRAFDWRTVVSDAGGDFAAHAVCVLKFGIGSHACTILVSGAIMMAITVTLMGGLTIVCAIESQIGNSVIPFDTSGFL